MDIEIGKQYRFTCSSSPEHHYIRGWADGIVTVTDKVNPRMYEIKSDKVSPHDFITVIYATPSELAEIEDRPKPIKRHVSLDVESDFVGLIEKVMSNDSPLRGAKLEIDQVLYNEETGEINGVYGTAYPLGGVDPEPFALGEPLR